MRMNTFTLVLLIFAAIFSFSSAFLRDARNDEHEVLEDPNRESLQKMKPWGNVPGAKLVAEEQIARFFPGVFVHEEKPKKRLTDRDKGRKKDVAPLENNKHKDKNLMAADTHKTDCREEETQQKRIDSVRQLN